VSKENRKNHSNDSSPFHFAHSKPSCMGLKVPEHTYMSLE
jgi:hypothetical protein